MTLGALDVPAAGSLDEWRDIGRKLCGSHRTLNWIIGDWLIEGSERFGERAQDEARAIFRSDVDRFDPILKTCRRFPAANRHEALTFGHHLAVMSIADDTEAERMLADAETHGLTAPMLKAQVRISSNRQPAFEDDPQDAAYRKLVQTWNASPADARHLLFEQVKEHGLGVIDL